MHSYKLLTENEPKRRSRAKISGVFTHICQDKTDSRKRNLEIIYVEEKWMHKRPSYVEHMEQMKSHLAVEIKINGHFHFEQRFTFCLQHILANRLFKDE